MKKELIRKEFFKLKLKGHSYNQCRRILLAKYGYEVHNRTLQRWMNKLDYDNSWDLKDCSRKPKVINRVTTVVVTKILDELGRVHGFPKQILTDNGSAYGLKSKHSKFDRWCRRRGIHHIRSAVHSPTTCGKVERLFQTFKGEIKFCNNDPELWRMRYNHFRPHTSLNGKTPDEVYFDFAKLF